MTHNDRRHNRERYEPDDGISKCDIPITTVRIEARIVRMQGENVRRSDESLTRTIEASGDRRASPPSSQLPIANPAPMRGRQSGCPNETRQVVLTRALERLKRSRWRSWRRRPRRRPGRSTSSPLSTGVVVVVRRKIRRTQRPRRVLAPVAVVGEIR